MPLASAASRRDCRWGAWERAGEAHPIATRPSGDPAGHDPPGGLARGAAGRELVDGLELGEQGLASALWKQLCKHGRMAWP